MQPDQHMLWPADKIERWPIDRIAKYERNSRVHSVMQVEQIARSIKEWGWTVPALVDEGGSLICGHARLEAAKKLGITEIPVMIARGWSNAQKQAYIIADNKLTLNSSWDNDILVQELGSFPDGFDLTLAGFSLPEIDVLVHSGEAVDPSKEWQGMPEFDQEDKTAFRSIRINFKDADAVAEFSALIGQDLSNRKQSIWFPEEERAVYSDKRYVSES